MAETNYRTYLKTDEVRVKKYFYVLRPILAAKWLMKYKSSPPMAFSELYDSVLIDELKPVVTELLEMKMQLPEMGTAPRIDVLNEYIDKSLTEIKEYAESIVDEKENDIEILDEFFINQLKSFK